MAATAEAYVPAEGWAPNLVTMSRAFHWMDQPVVLARIDSYAAPEAGVVTLTDRSLWTAPNDWQQRVREVVQEFLGPRRRAGAGAFAHHGRSDAEVLGESSFADVTEHRVPVTREWTVEGVLGYLSSTSFASPAQFGKRLPAFEARVAAALAPYLDQGRLVEENEFTVTVGRRCGRVV